MAIESDVASDTATPPDTRQPRAAASSATPDVRDAWQRAWLKVGFPDEWSSERYEEFCSQWDAIARQFASETLPEDDDRATPVREARELEEMVSGWRRSLESAFVDGRDLESIGDPAWDTKTIRVAVSRLRNMADAVIGGSSTPEAATDKRLRIAFMRFLERCVDEGFEEWPDLDKLGHALSFLECPEGQLADATRRKSEMTNAAAAWQDSLPQGFEPGDWTTLVDVYMLRLAYDALPEVLRVGLAKIERSTLNELVMGWAERRQGRRKASEVSKFLRLESVLRRSIDAEVSADTLKTEWTQSKQSKRGRSRNPVSAKPSKQPE